MMHGPFDHGRTAGMIRPTHRQPGSGADGGDGGQVGFRRGRRVGGDAMQQGEIAAKDGYVELFIPVVKDLPGLKSLNLDVGGRYSDYSNTPNATTFKINVDAQIINSLRVRAGYFYQGLAERCDDVVERGPGMVREIWEE